MRATGADADCADPRLRYTDEEFRRECTEQYLEQRRNFRLTGQRQDMKKKEVIF